MPSRFEPFGIAFVEAMSWGLPCIGTTSCAMPEIITDGRTGYVVPPGDGDRLAERMLDLVERPASAAAMGRAGRERFLADFTWDRVAERMVAAIAAHGGGARG
jgi:glycosyltransferase involved in cell wall biosynthesis